MPRRADLVERRNQGILVVGLERHVGVKRGICGQDAYFLPFIRDSFLRVLHYQVVPTWCEECRNATQRNGYEEEEHRVQMTVHEHRGKPNGVYNITN